MKIIRHTARDMRQALRAVREQLGEDAVILSSRRTAEGVEVTAAVDFDASTLEAGGFADVSAAVMEAKVSQPTAAAHSVAALTHTAPIAAPARTSLVAVPDSLPRPSAAPAQEIATALEEPQAQESPSYDQLAAHERLTNCPPDARYGTEWISAAAREAVAEHIVPSRVPVLAAAPKAQATEIPLFRTPTQSDPVIQAREAALVPFGPQEGASVDASVQPSAASAAASDTMSNELKTLRRMLETQLAHLAWNDRTRRAPVHTEMLRELTEIGLTADLSEHLVRQLPEDTDLTFARRFTIAGLSQYLKVTGDRWLDEGGRVAFVGAAGVGKTTTLAKVAVRWVLRHGAHDVALVAADSVRIGAQDQLRSLAQLLGVPVYTPDTFESLPTLLGRLKERLVLIDTPGSGARDPQLDSRLAVLAGPASKLETALVLAASTQTGAIEDALKRFAPAKPACCVLTKIDEAVSLGGVLSNLIRARLPISYLSEGQRVPEDLRPARALELVSAAVQLAKARGAAADEDLLRRRFGKSAYGIS